MGSRADLLIPRRQLLAPRWLLAAAIIALTSAVVTPAWAQLLSPGKLSNAHAGLEGMNNCTSCHELGKRGAADTKCLACHEVLKTRIEKKTGLHPAFADRSCTSCHKEHFGVQFAVLKFDTAGFDHSKTGYDLRLSHQKAGCRSCHKAAGVADAAVRTYATEHKTLDRTFLGLSRTCLGCHRADDVHAGQFGTRSCTDCHTEKTWKEAPNFNHDGTRYALTGQHREVRCSGCHQTAPVAGSTQRLIRFTSAAFSSCSGCHKDPHRGAMAQGCESCHSTDGWNRLNNRSKFEAGFDHSRTRFTLKGAHVRATCDKCHAPKPVDNWTVRLTFAASPGRNAYPAPRAADCLSCHVDVHQNAFAKTSGGPGCQNCHTESSWQPVTYDFARHSRETYQLTGAHVAVPCASCHTPATPGARVPRFHLEAKECSSCHAKSDPHQGQFPGRACSECHNTSAFRSVTFDHSKTRYPLDGAHQKVACASCHQKTTSPQGSVYVRYRGLETSCRSCHGAAIPRKS